MSPRELVTHALDRHSPRLGESDDETARGRCGHVVCGVSTARWARLCVHGAGSVHAPSCHLTPISTAVTTTQKDTCKMVGSPFLVAISNAGRQRQPARQRVGPRPSQTRAGPRPSAHSELPQLCIDARSGLDPQRERQRRNVPAGVERHRAADLPTEHGERSRPRRPRLRVIRGRRESRSLWHGCVWQPASLTPWGQGFHTLTCVGRAGRQGVGHHRASPWPLRSCPPHRR